MFTVLRSSAGAGKTHVLVRTYLDLCLRGNGPDAYRRVLALTFTNKAAGEMKQRAMEVLLSLARGDVASAADQDIRDHLMSTLGIEADVLRIKAAATFEHMLHHWSGVGISTIDAFIRRLVRPFAKDLQLDHDLRMTTDQTDYLARAVEQLIGEAGTATDLTDLLMSIGTDLLDEERSWRPDLPLYALAEELDKERSLEHLKAYRAMSLQRFLTVRDALRARENAFASQVRALGQRVLAAIAAAGLEADDLYHKKSGPFGFFDKLAHFSGELPVNQHVLRCMETGQWTAAKVGHDVVERVAPMVPLLEEAVRQVENWREREYPAYLIVRAVGVNLLPAAALHLLDERLERIKLEDGVNFFSDLTRKVVDMVRTEPAPFLFERLGERYRHILIDEFQDTSLMQWHALLPLAENALGNGGHVFLVGDAKQAIYRWRNGEVRQFIDLPFIHGREALPDGEVREMTLRQHFKPSPPLLDNRRSGRAIVAFNNALFQQLGELLPGSFKVVYTDVAQESYRSAQGYVHLRSFSSKEENEEEGAEPDGAIEAVHSLRWVQEALSDGATAGDIAVLVRTGLQASRIARHLEKNGIAVSTTEGASLGSDPAACAIVVILRFLLLEDPPSAVRTLHLLAALGVTGVAGWMDPRVRAHPPMDPIEQLRGWLRMHPSVTTRAPLVELIGNVAEALDHAPASNAAVMALVQEAHVFTEAGTGDIAGFLEHWERSVHARTVNGGGNAVLVLTIHRSKGLQFPVVIVPHTSMSGRKGPRDLLWVDPGTAVPELTTALVRPTNALAEAGLKEVEAEFELEKLDELDLLYVAFTRARERLYALVDEASPTGSFGAVLLDRVRSAGDGRSFTAGERRPLTGGETPRDDLAIPVVRRGSWRQQVAIRRMAPEAWDPADPDPLRRWGTTIHEILSQTAEASALPTAVEAARRRGQIDTETAASIIRTLGPLLTSDMLRPFFGAGLSVRTEASVIGADGRVLRPDRIVRDAHGLHVLDIKTGGPGEQHHEQVRRYVQVLEQISDGPVTGHLLYLRTGDLVQVA